jgi:asparagine synthase (glutamine-hydrolysing)
MCGIAGIVDDTLPAQERGRRVRAMCDAMVHRGPDDEGQWSDETVSIGMRRLSIVDLPSGHQPMATPDERWWIVFNGEIFNYKELRPGLEARGASFRTTSDTEVLLEQISRDGIDGIRHLNGMFGFALWDRRDRVLRIARDRMGVKPLYYWFEEGRLIFASEIKAVLAALDERPRIDSQSVWDYLSFRYVPGPRSIWQGIRKLQPGHMLTWRAQDRSLQVERYWSIPYAAEPEDRGDEAHDREFAALIEDSVRLRMIADVPVGVTLSGGLDSSVVAALAARHTGRLNTFSVAFDDPDAVDERPFARQVARAIGATHHEVAIDRDTFMDSLPAFVRSTDEPLADLASIPLFHVCRLARGEVKVALSGEGSDEILAGYDLELRQQAWDAAPGRSWLDRLLGRPDPRDQRFAAAPPSMTNYLDAGVKARLMRGKVFADSLDPLRSELEALGPQQPLHQVLYCFSQHWLVEDLLMKADKMSMATSLELRTPFLDYRLVEWAARTPSRIKAGPDARGTYVSKRVLRRFAGNLVPAEIIDRPKQGFPVPVYGWLSGSLKGWAGDHLLSQAARSRDLLDPAELAGAVAKGTAVDAGVLDRHRLWNLLILETWLREWGSP